MKDNIFSFLDPNSYFSFSCSSKKILKIIILVSLLITNSYVRHCWGGWRIGVGLGLERRGEWEAKRVTGIGLVTSCRGFVWQSLFLRSNKAFSLDNYIDWCKKKKNTLLKIRSDIDDAFRESRTKAPSLGKGFHFSASLCSCFLETYYSLAFVFCLFPWKFLNTSVAQVFGAEVQWFWIC